MFAQSFKAGLRWFNLHPIWRASRVKVWGSSLRAPTFDRWLALWLHRTGRMGVADRQWLASMIQPGMTIVDIGANQGLYTLLFSRLTGAAGQVHAFEPDDLLFASLQENVRSNAAANVQVYPLALGAAPGVLTLHRSLLNSGDNRLATTTDRSPRETVAVQVARLDQVLVGTRIDFLKMDVQGWEMEVLRGMEHLFAPTDHPTLAMYFEFWPQGLRNAGTNPVELLQFLVDRGFAISRCERPGVLRPETDLAALVAGIKGDAYTNLYAWRG